MLSLEAVESCRLQIEYCISHQLVGLYFDFRKLYSFIWVYLHWLVMLPVLMEPLLIPPVSQRCPIFHMKSMLPTFSHHFPYALVRRKLKLESTIPQLSWLCMSTIPSTFTGSWTSCSLSYSTLYSVAEYLMLVDGGCLNSLLLANSIHRLQIIYSGIGV